jgi:hypothetical protein
MLGLRFVKVPPTTYLFEYRHGRVVREGAGLSIFCFGPSTSLVAVPCASVDVPFMFEERTADFQTITIQGQVTYRIADPRRLAAMMDFALAPEGNEYASDDPEKLPQRVLEAVQVKARASINALPLREALAAAESLGSAVRQGLDAAPELIAIGLEILGLAILAIRPTPETARALEAGARERLLREADEAVYARRNAAVEQERAIKENELNTEIAIENKRRQIRETQVDAERAVQDKQRVLQREAMESRVDLERQKQTLVELSAINARTEAEARADGIGRLMAALGTSDPRLVQALANTGMDPGQIIATAFQELAVRADRIGQLNVTPDLLQGLLTGRHPAAGAA